MISLATRIAVAIVALIHVYILVLEMFLWDKPTGMRSFGLTPERARDTKVLAANQGLYNGFLAAGLFWTVFAGSHAMLIGHFFLLCVFVAGLYGAITASRKILFVQAIPAAIALALMFLT